MNPLTQHLVKPLHVQARGLFDRVVGGIVQDSEATGGPDGTDPRLVRPVEDCLDKMPLLLVHQIHELRAPDPRDEDLRPYKFDGQFSVLYLL